MDAAPPLQPPTIRVSGAADHQSYYLFGLIAHGKADDLKRLKDAATSLNLTARNAPSGDGSYEEMVFFDSRTSRSSAVGVLRRSRSGEFGPIQIEVMLLPVPLTLNGSVSFDKIDVEPATFIENPQP